ncbi:MAG TPA: hypothetical protein VLM42_02050 [Bryobacteraceae bacterium]|nr:hypothetical protein [Bryobacteraceae bacterium]
MSRLRQLPLILAMSLGTTSCLFQKKTAARVFVPPPPVARPSVVSVVPEIPAAPELELDSEMPQIEGFPESLPASAGPPPPAPRRAAPPPRATAPPPAVIPTEPPPTMPKLGQIFTADQLREYNRSLDESLDRVRRVLGSVAGKNLNPELAQIVGRIQTFQKQAEQAREQDLVTAVNLARRADLLAQDLGKRLP